MTRWPEFALLFIVSACTASSTASSTGPARFPPEFRVTAVRGLAAHLPISGNSLDGFHGALAEGARAVEADFRLDADGDLVAGHNDALGGDCGSASRATTAELRRCRLVHGYRIATLPQLLALGFDEIYLDLKDTLNTAKAAHAVDRAIADVRGAKRAQSVVIMTYATPAAVARLRDATDIRAGLKGYPRTTRDALRMNRTAAANGFELVCIGIDQATVAVVKDAARRGVWHLPWAGTETVLATLRRAAAGGIGGVITARYGDAIRDVAPAWVSPAHFAR
jgi:glycerophosphoryl diester phosphodiesterase